MPPRLTKAERLSRLRAKAPQSDTHKVVLDPAPLEALRHEQAELERLRLVKDTAGVALAEDRVEAAQAAADEAVEVLTLLGLPRDVYEHLQGLCPPTKEQQERKETYDVDTFLPLLVSACVVDDPDSAQVLSLDDAQAFDPDTPLPGRLMSAKETADTLAPWNQAEVAILWNKAVAVCTTARSAGLPFGSGRTRG